MENEVKTEVKEEKLYSQQEVDELLQKEGDRRVSMALKKRESELNEAAKLSAMNQQEKAEYELQKREADIARREKDIALSEQKLTAVKILSENRLPIELVDFVVNENAEVTQSNIKTMTKIFNDAIASGIKEKIGGSVNVGTASVGMTKEQFSKMSIAEQQHLYKSNPDLYKAMINK